MTSNGGKAGSLTATATTLTLAKADSSKTAITFNFTKANYGYSAAIANTLEIDTAGGTWANAKQVILAANVLSQTYTTADLNSVLLSMNLTPGKAQALQIRVMQSISTSSPPTVAPIYSNVIKLTATPYAVVNISYLYVPGDYQGWAPATADSLISLTSNGIYQGVINFPAGGTFQFKLTPAKNFSASYGSAGAGKISLTASANLTVPTAGSYLIVADINAGTITETPFVWSIIGDATTGGWNTDTDMKFNNGPKQQWELTTPLTAGGFKFRKNHDWGVSYGSLTTPGILDTQNNNNITVTTAGNYSITLNVATLTYTITKK